MKRLAFLLLLTTYFLANSCKKPKEPLLLDKEFLSYFAFPKGSWWVYKDAKSELSDSFYVEIYNKSIEETKEMGSFESLIYDVYSKYGKSYGQAIPQGSNNCTYQTDGTEGHAYRLATSDYVQYINEIYQFSMKHLDSFQVNNIWYKDVYQTECLKRINNTIRNEYYAKNIGVIKRVYLDSTEMELVKYHINK